MYILWLLALLQRCLLILHQPPIAVYCLHDLLLQVGTPEENVAHMFNLSKQIKYSDL